MSKGHSSRRGFSLVEAMISATVLGIALVGLVQMHTTSVQRTVESEKVGRATEIARQIADRTA
ncbi:MAG: prepilin-type N-terminal cleavage/methylation domain-containing protein, partial [Myxococcota bacterium]